MMHYPVPDPVPDLPPPPSPFRRLKIILSSAALILGLTAIVVTFQNGGGIQSRGVLLGAILAVLAGMRLYITIKHES